MGNFVEFAQLLEKKIRQEIKKEFSQDEKTTPLQNEIHSELWTHLVGQLDAVYFNQSQKAKAYHRFRSPPRPRPDHVFSTDQEKALQFFHNHNVNLPLNMSQRDLTKAFRLLALKLHPDHGGSSVKFQSLLKARSELQALFVEAAKAAA